MFATHIYDEDSHMTAPRQEGHSVLNALNDDAIRQCRSVSPKCSSNSSVPRYERNVGIFRQLSRQFGLRSDDDLIFSHGCNEDDTQSSSTDSCSLSAAAVASSNNKKYNNQKEIIGYISCASSETSSTADIDEQLQHMQQQHASNEEENKQNDENGADETVSNKNTDNDNDDDGDDAAAKSAYNKKRKSFSRSSFSLLHRRSTSSIRRAFGAFSLSSRSLSCSGVTPPPILPTSSTSSSTNIGTPNKTALKSSSNLELNKKSQAQHMRSTFSTTKKSFCSSSSCTAAPSASVVSKSASSKTKTKPPPQRILRQPVSYTYLKGISGLPTQRVPRNSVCCQYARR